MAEQMQDIDRRLTEIADVISGLARRTGLLCGLSTAILVLLVALGLGTVAHHVKSSKTNVPLARPTDSVDLVEWPPKDVAAAIAGSSAIGYAKASFSEGVVMYRLDRLLMIRPGIRMGISVGDVVYREVLEPGITFGEAEIVFFLGNPAMEAGSWSVHSGTVCGSAQMALSKFEAMVKSAGQMSGDNH